jgi:hypothetical protein
MAGFAASEALAAVSMSLCSGADSAYLFDLLDGHGVAHEYGRRESTASAWHQAGSALAYAAGGALAEIDLGLPYLATALVALAAFATAATRGADRPVRAPVEPSARRAWRSWLQHMRQALGDVAGSGRLGWMIGYSAVVFVLLRASEYLYQPLLKSHHLSYVEIGLVFAAVYLVASVVAHRGYALRQRFGDEPLLWGMLGGLALSFVLLAEVRGGAVLLLLGVQAIANGLYSPLVKPLINREVPDSARRATVLSVESIVRRGAMGVFAPIAGLYGAHSAMQLCGVIGLGGLAVLAAVTLRRVSWRGAPTPSPPPPPIGAGLAAGRPGSPAAPADRRPRPRAGARPAPRRRTASTSGCWRADRRALRSAAAARRDRRPASRDAPRRIPPSAAAGARPGRVSAVARTPAARRGTGARADRTAACRSARSPAATRCATGRSPR